MAIQPILRNDDYFPYMHCVVAYITLKYFFEQYLNLRQMRLFTIRDIPSSIEQLLGITQKQFKRSQKFYYDKLAFEMYTKSIKAVLEIIIIICHVMPFIWDINTTIFKLNRYSEFQRGLAYIFVESLRQKLIDVPNNFYNAHVIERRYGLSQVSFAIQFQDLVIETALMVILVPLFLSGYLYVMERGGEYFFVYMQIFVLIIAIVSNLVYPNYIQPLFNNFKELDESTLKTSIQTLAISMKFPLDKVLIMDGSKRSDHSNAYFFGVYSKRIVLYDTLVAQLNEQEILAVVGHEMGHWKYRHPYINLAFFCMKILVTFYIFGFFRNTEAIFLSFGFKEKSIFIGSALFFSLFEPINSLFQQIELLISRQFEKQADQFACYLGYGENLMTALIKLFKQNSTALLVDPWYQLYYNSHPTLFERLDFLKRRMAKYD